MCEVVPGKYAWWLGQRDSQLGGLSLNLVSVARISHVDISSSLLHFRPRTHFV